MKAKHILFLFACGISIHVTSYAISESKVDTQISTNAFTEDESVNFFPTSPALTSIADKFMEITEMTLDEYNFKKLTRLNGKCNRLLACSYDSLHPSQKLSTDKKAYRMLEEIEAALDMNTARTTRDMEYVLALKYYFQRYRMVALSHEILQSDAAFMKEIKAWQNLHETFDEFCSSVVLTEWFKGSGANSAVLSIYIAICESRVDDLKRLLGREKTDKITDTDLGRTRLITNANHIAAGVNPPQKYLKDFAETDLDHYSSIWESMQDAKSSLPIVWDQWIKVRRKGFSTISSDISTKSAWDMTDKFSEIVLSCKE